MAPIILIAEARLDKCIKCTELAVTTHLKMAPIMCSNYGLKFLKQANQVCVVLPVKIDR